MATDPLSGEIAEFTPRLRAFARSLGHDDVEADELAQETCLRALGARERFTPGSNLRAWLFTILRNLHLNRRRDRASRPGIVAIEELAAERGVELDAPTRVEREALARAQVAEVGRVFRTLPATFAVPLHLVAVEDMSYAQVAAILGVPAGTVMSRVYRARRLLLRRLAEDWR